MGRGCLRRFGSRLLIGLGSDLYMTGSPRVSVELSVYGSLVVDFL